MAQIEISISGRIPKYFFGVLKEEYREEIKEALRYCDEIIETENDFLNYVFNLFGEVCCGMHDKNNSAEVVVEKNPEIFSVISEDNLKKLPNFYSLVRDFIDYGGSHFEMIGRLFDSPELYKYGSLYGLIFFEDDAKISIMDYNTDEYLLEETYLSEFTKSNYNKSYEESIKDSIRINKLISSNLKFGFPSKKDENLTFYKNELGATFISCKLNYPELQIFNNTNPVEHQVTIYFDEVSNFNFYIDCKNEEFDMKNLTFLNYSSAQKFRNSACQVIFSHLFYKNKLIELSENTIHFDDHILMYGESRCGDGLESFINN